MKRSKIKVKTEKKCRQCGGTFTPFRTTQPFCSPHCQIEHRKDHKPKENKRSKPIPKMSKKRRVEKLQYDSDRVIFLSKKENSICFIDGCNQKATTIEHRAGRIGTNYLDQKTWAGCCGFHNLELEMDPVMAKKYQLSKLHGGKKI